MQRGSGESDSRTQEEVDTNLGRVFVESVKIGRRNQTATRILAVSLVFDVTLSLGLGLIVGSQRHATDNQKELLLEVRHRALAVCNEFNKRGAGELDLWAGPLKPPPPLRSDAPPDEVAAYQEGLRARAEFSAKLHKNFDPVKCSLDVTAP